MPQTDLFYRFGIALVIGMLIGLERQRRQIPGEQPREELFAGVRTFPLFALAGCSAALLADTIASPWPLATAILVLGLLVVVGYWHQAQRQEVGVTTEVAAVVTLLVGALCYWNHLALAGAVGVTTMLLLSLKIEIHRFARQVTQEDIYATLKFAVITVIILPILPNDSFGPPPLDVLNPYRIWLMVVFISGISFLGYILMKLVDARQGIALTGLLGGLASSTAVTLSFAERSRQHGALAGAFALGIIMAWTVMFVRVGVAVAALNRPLLAVLWPVLVASTLAALAYAAFLYWTRHPSRQEGVQVANPFSLGPAIQFGLLYALILLVTRTAELYFGQSGIYLSALIAGVADVDAITLSMAELSSHRGGLALPVAANAILLAILSNTLVKAGVVFATGSRELRPALLPSVALVVLAGAATLFFVR